jgi:hypothetical protein
MTAVVTADCGLPILAIASQPVDAHWHLMNIAVAAFQP